MRKLLLGMLILASSLFADIDDSLKSMGDSGGMVGGGLGLAAPHIIFWLPVILFLIVAIGTVMFYYKQFQQKDDGMAKVILAIIVGIFFGVLVHTLSLKVVDGALDSKDCGKAIGVAYLKDAIQKGLNPTGYVFGSKIKEVGCLNN